MSAGADTQQVKSRIIAQYDPLHVQLATGRLKSVDFDEARKSRRSVQKGLLLQLSRALRLL